MEGFRDKLGEKDSWNYNFYKSTAINWFNHPTNEAFKPWIDYGGQGYKKQKTFVMQNHFVIRGK